MKKKIIKMGKRAEKLCKKIFLQKNSDKILKLYFHEKNINYNCC